MVEKRHIVIPDFEIVEDAMNKIKSDANFVAEASKILQQHFLAEITKYIEIMQLLRNGRSEVIDLFYNIIEESIIIGTNKNGKFTNGILVDLKLSSAELAIIQIHDKYKHIQYLRGMAEKDLTINKKDLEDKFIPNIKKEINSLLKIRGVKERLGIQTDQ